jgi:hypothetical protein
LIYSKQQKRARLPGGFFHLEEEKSRTRAYGYGHGDHIKLKDEYGTEWRGSAVRNPDNSVTYRFRTARGVYLSGVANDEIVVLRDDRGNSWKGIVS